MSCFLALKLPFFIEEMSLSMEGDKNKLPNCLGALWTVVGGGVDKIVVLVDVEMKCKRVSFNYETDIQAQESEIRSMGYLVVIGLNLPLSTDVVSLYTGPCAERCGFLVAVEDFAVDDLAVEDFAVDNLAVEDFAVDDLADLVDFAVDDLAEEDFADLVDGLPLVFFETCFSFGDDL